MPLNQRAFIMRLDILGWLNQHLCNDYICEFVRNEIKQIISTLIPPFSTYRNRYKLTETQLQKVREDIKKELSDDNDGNARLTCSSGGTQTWKCGPQSNRLLVFGAWAYAIEVDTCQLCPIQNCCSQHDDCWAAVQKQVTEKTYEKCDLEFSNCVMSGYSEDLACQVEKQQKVTQSYRKVLEMVHQVSELGAQIRESVSFIRLKRILHGYLTVFNYG